MVEDNARVECVASQKDLTRISLVGDAFASVSKVQPENPLDDFSVVNEPTRGDIYLSVPGGFKAKALSFFGTSKKGFVYKFACRIEPSRRSRSSSNPGAAAAAKSADADEGDQQAPDLDETAVRLVQAMAGQKVVPGFRWKRPRWCRCGRATSPSSCSPSTAAST
jgi:conjugal transfer pilus assembly protein TraK